MSVLADVTWISQHVGMYMDLYFVIFSYKRQGKVP